MANIVEPSCVNYVCSCGHLNPITKLYFCRYCLKLRCGFCVCHEVDSHFCCNCLENIPSGEAKLKRNQCNKCFDCPSCQHTLSSRATTIQIPKRPEAEGGKNVGGGDLKPRKMYYLTCLACRWTSRDVGIPDQATATGQWPECEYSNATRFSLLMEHYQTVVQQEKQEKQDLWRRKAPKQHKYPNLTDRTGLTASIIRRQMGLSDKTAPKIKQSTINPSLATDVVQELPDDIFSKEIILSNITTVKQRLNHPSVQPSTVNNLYPLNKNLSIKRSLRCRQCEHNIIKPEYNPVSVKYRIQLFASYHVPEVRLMKCGPLNAGSSTQILIKIINPTLHEMTITIMDLPTHEEESLIIEEMKKKSDHRQPLGPMASLNSAFSRQASLNEEPKFVDQKVTGTIALPDSSFMLQQRDDSTEYDDDHQVTREEPKFVVWRRSNKVAVELTVNPLDCKSGDEVVVGFSMQYTYVNTATSGAVDKKEPQTHALTSRVYLRIGKIK
ncbi:dynactin subunit 4 [Bradysia coprophila]|uniref:dynactin subunit 4 n=1 Tax=Bradysia coprophila TaxID=38358 RepID=UPI00187D9054|nr:dynactin subunit 4 [Bradysia coprophila]